MKWYFARAWACSSAIVVGVLMFKFLLALLVNGDVSFWNGCWRMKGEGRRT